MGGISKAQWSVIGMLIVLLLMEGILNPSINSAIVRSWQAINIPKTGKGSDQQTLPVTAPAPKDGNDIGAGVVPTQQNPMIRSWRG